jgi:hypothetical protein
MNTLHRRILGATAVAAALAAAGSACAQSSANVSTTGSATIFQPIAISKTADLAFGTIVRPLAGSGAVTINAATGARTVDPGVGQLGSGFHQATYSVTGEGGQAFNIGIPTGFIMTRTGGSETLTVNLASSVTSGTLSSSLGSQGTQTFGVGGTLTVSNTTASGAYQGTFTVTVNYQ